MSEEGEEEREKEEKEQEKEEKEKKEEEEELEKGRSWRSRKRKIRREDMRYRRRKEDRVWETERSAIKGRGYRVDSSLTFLMLWRSFA